MPIKKIKGTTPGRRQMSSLTFEELSGNKARKSLLKAKKQKAGRSGGTIAVRHRGGGHKRKMRVVDFDRSDKLGIEATVKSIDYDPGRSAFLALVCYKDGAYRYILAANDMKVGDKIMTAEKCKARSGNRMHLENIPVGFEIYNVEMKLGSKGKIAKSAGSYAKLTSLDGEYAQVQLPSGEVRFVPKTCFATIGRVSNPDHGLVVIGKAGRNRWKGKKPTVRGKVMNPKDHPHGGGEGSNPIGMAYPKTPWGQHALGVKTRRRKSTNRWIVRDRRGKNIANVK